MKFRVLFFFRIKILFLYVNKNDLKFKVKLKKSIVSILLKVENIRLIGFSLFNTLRNLWKF